MHCPPPSVLAPQLLPPLLLLAAIGGAEARWYSVVDYGALGDNYTDDTVAFEKAIAAAAATDCSTAPTGCGVFVPGHAKDLPGPPAAYKIRPINLTSHMALWIQGGARIVGMPDTHAWPIIPPLPSYGQGRNHGAFSPRYTSLLHGENLTNVTIRGDGAGTAFIAPVLY
jgi:polygalacturonase|eukprot:COSAG06_NODE_1771_length_8429_cov_4.298679_7_plen_169_part_00